METHAVAAKKVHCMRIVIAKEDFLIVVQWRVKTAPGAKSAENASKQVSTTMETPSVRAKDSQQPNYANVSGVGSRSTVGDPETETEMDSSQTALQMCQQVPGVINAANVGRLKCKKALRQDVLTATYGGQKLRCVPQTSPTRRTTIHMLQSPRKRLHKLLEYHSGGLLSNRVYINRETMQE